MEAGKIWYSSKTLWLNVISIVAIVAQGQFGYVIDPVIQTYALSAVNILLRAVTKAPVEWS